MSACHFPALSALALQAATALTRYQRHVRELADSWLDMDLYNTVSEEIDDIRRLCIALPDVNVAWAALLVSHADLIRALWYCSHGDRGTTDEDVARCLEEHVVCIQALVRRCMRVAERSGGRL